MSNENYLVLAQVDPSTIHLDVAHLNIWLHLARPDFMAALLMFGFGSKYTNFIAALFCFF